MTLRQALIHNEHAEDMKEAHRIVREMTKEATEIIESGGNICEVENILYQYGLEPDYLMEIMPV